MLSHVAWCLNVFQALVQQTKVMVVIFFGVRFENLAKLMTASVVASQKLYIVCMIGMTYNLRVKIDLKLCLTLKVQCVIPCLNEDDVNTLSVVETESL